MNPATKAAAKPADDDDDVDLFGDEDEEESEQTKQRLAEYAKKKANSNRQGIEHSLVQLFLLFQSLPLLPRVTLFSM